MEYLVEMTTAVPAGTPDAEVDEARAREAAHSGKLALQGYLLRLWRPPLLQPGEWRSIGLFAADDDAELDEILRSMPLRAWRTDKPTPLSPHPHDPADQPTDQPSDRESAEPATAGQEFLTTFTIAVPPGTPGQEAANVEAQEAARAQELAVQGHLERLWQLPGNDRELGLWRAGDAGQMAAMLASLPLSAWMSVETTPLDPHPSDPALAAG